MDNAEQLCDQRFVKAEYQRARPAGPATQNSFDILICPQAGGRLPFSVAESDGDQFAAELDVLAKLIRARVARARMNGEDAAR